MKKTITIGSRGSRLALIQSELVRARLSNVSPATITIQPIKTQGDIQSTAPIHTLGNKSVFIKEIEQALLSGEIDIAVHSLKDMSARPTDGLTISAYLEREDPRDVLISKSGAKLQDLPSGAKIGTSSPRRIAQLRLIRPDIRILEIRGNVDTRIKKVESGEYDGTVLAYAGIKRLGLEDKITEFLPLENMIPAAGQGVIAVQVRSPLCHAGLDPASPKLSDFEIIDLVSHLDNKDQRRISEFEFEELRRIGATCRTPVGMYTEIVDSEIVCKMFLNGVYAILPDKS